METVKKVEKVEKVEKVVLPRRRIQQRVAPLGAIPFALLLDASLVLGCPGGRRAAARLDPFRIGPSVRLWFAGAESPTRFCVRIQQQVEARPAVGCDLLLDATHLSRRRPVMPVARCSPPVPTHHAAAALQPDRPSHPTAGRDLAGRLLVGCEFSRLQRADGDVATVGSSFRQVQLAGAPSSLRRASSPPTARCQRRQRDPRAWRAMEVGE